MDAIKDIKIDDEFITLSQFLKITDLINSGGEAKSFIYFNNIFVNDEYEDRRGKKLYKGDVVKINNEVFKIC